MPDAGNLDPLPEFIGEPVDPADLRHPRAQGLARFLQARDDVGARLVAARRRDDVEWLILAVDVDVGQVPVADIRRQEPIAVGFNLADNAWPQTLALRPDFPDDVSHQFLRAEGEPVSLCLSEEAWQEARLRWSPGAFIRLLRSWLIDTARGMLHRADQVVEPFIAVAATKVILPTDLFDPDRQGAPLFGFALGQESDGAPIYSFSFRAQSEAAKAVAAAFVTAPRIHGVVRRPPRTLEELIAIFGEGDPSFAGSLDEAVRVWLRQPALHHAMPLLIIQVPMLREEGAEPERRDPWPFILDASVVEVGIALELWSDLGGGGEVLPWDRKPGPYGGNIKVVAANLMYDLCAQQAADYNGLNGPSGRSIAAVGAGAIGSQVTGNLTRMGESVSTVVDEDRLLPHNLARHAVWDRGLLGWAKARATALMIARAGSGASNASAILADVTDPEGDAATDLLAALRSSDIILDMAASVAVSRHLALEDIGTARRVAAFLSPSGHDLVLLAEDSVRLTRLDHLEMALYGAILTEPALDGHFAIPEGRRYARGCREVSARVSQTAIALHAAIAADQVRRVADKDEAAAGVWRLDREDMTVRHVALDVRPMVASDIGSWTVLISPALIDAMKAARASKLPVETGGVLLGTFDADRRTIYVVWHVPSPPDSIETPDGYIRGAFGTAEAVQTAQFATLSMLGYVGEWHSHPDGCPAMPSEHDWELFGSLAYGMEVEGHPPVMIIVGDDDVGVVTGA